MSLRTVSCLVAVSGMPFFTANGPKAQTGSASAHGACSIAHSGSGDTYIIKNCGIGAEQGVRIIELLDKVLANQSGETTNRKLDELIRVASQPSVQYSQSCTGGNCNLNGQQYVDQRQFGVAVPPPLIASFTNKALPPEDLTKPASIYEEGNKRNMPGADATFTVASMFLQPMFLLRCSAPCIVTFVAVEGTSSPMFLNTDRPDVILVSLGLNGPLMPGRNVFVRVRSIDSKPVSILGVESYAPTLTR